MALKNAGGRGEEEGIFVKILLTSMTMGTKLNPLLCIEVVVL